MGEKELAFTFVTERISLSNLLLNRLILGRAKRHPSGCRAPEQARPLQLCWLARQEPVAFDRLRLRGLFG